MPNSLNRTELADLVRQHASAGDSGTILVRSSDGHSLMVVLEKGELLAISFGNHRGSDALPDIIKFSTGTYSFTDGLLGRQQADLPSAEDFARMLQEAVDNGTLVSTGGSFKSPDLLEQQVAGLLMEYVGPISAVLCENAVDEVGGISSVGDADDFVAKLSREIVDQEERARFESKAAGMIKLLK